MSDEFVAAKNAGPLALISTFVTSCSCTLYSRRPTAMHRMNQTRKSRCFKNVGDIRGEGVHMHDRLQAFGRQIYAYHDCALLVCLSLFCLVFFLNL